MALYLLGVVRQVGDESSIPGTVLAGLEERQKHNAIRCRALLREAGTLCGWFRDAGIPFAVLKGITLSPDSVPDCASRLQTDLDFMVRRKDLKIACHFASRLGYRVHADDGATIEFRAGQCGKPDILNAYSVRAQRALELHVVDDDAALLARSCVRTIDGVAISSLSPEDILVQQAMHLLKHLCGEHARLSWVLEFRRHVAARHADTRFWEGVWHSAASTRNGELALGVALWLSNNLFGPDGFGRARWSADSLPERIKLWLSWYSERVFLSGGSGSKAYLLLRDEIARGTGETTRTRSFLIPVCLPVAIYKPAEPETASLRILRYSTNARYFFQRLRFHVFEGVRFGVEAARWRRAIARMQPSLSGEGRAAARMVSAARCVPLQAVAVAEMPRNKQLDTAAWRQDGR